MWESRHNTTYACVQFCNFLPISHFGQPIPTLLSLLSTDYMSGTQLTQISTSLSCDLKWTVCKPANSFRLFLQLLSRLLNYLLPFVTTIFVGHIGNAELAGYALASAVLYLRLLSLIICCTCSRTNFISCETLLGVFLSQKHSFGFSWLERQTETLNGLKD